MRKIELTNGVLKINDIRIEFASASVEIGDGDNRLKTFFPTQPIEATPHQTASEGKGLTTDLIFVPAGKNGKKATVKTPGPGKSRTLDTSMVKSILDLIGEHERISKQAIIDQLKCNQKTLTNALYNAKKAGKIVQLGAGIYGPVKDKAKVVMSQKLRAAGESNGRRGKSLFTNALDDLANTVTTDIKLDVEPLYKLGDKVKIGTYADVTDDDILDFPEEHIGSRASIVKLEEGSNLITVLIESTEEKILVYPHWFTKL